MRFTTLLAILCFLGVQYILSIAFFDQLPEHMASHWNAASQADDTLPRFWGTLLLPMVSTVIALLMLLLPLIDPLRKNLEKFRNAYDGFIVMLVIFFSYMHVLMLMWNLGYHLHMGRFILLGLALLFLYIGTLLQQAKRNWFVGIRTPWTLSSDTVWEKTHRVGSWLAILTALACLIGAIEPTFGYPLLLVSVGIFVVVSTGYSYVVYRREGAA